MAKIIYILMIYTLLTSIFTSLYHANVFMEIKYLNLVQTQDDQFSNRAKIPKSERVLKCIQPRQLYFILGI